jgi:hypothetical protein
LGERGIPRAGSPRRSGIRFEPRLGCGVAIYADSPLFGNFIDDSHQINLAQKIIKGANSAGIARFCYIDICQESEAKHRTTSRDDFFARTSAQLNIGHSRESGNPLVMSNELAKLLFLL